MIKAAECPWCQNSLHWFLGALRGEFPVKPSLNTSSPEFTIFRSCVYWRSFWWNEIIWNLQLELFYIYQNALFIYCCLFTDPPFLSFTSFSCENCAGWSHKIHFWRTGSPLERDWFKANTFTYKPDRQEYLHILFPHTRCLGMPVPHWQHPEW